MKKWCETLHDVLVYPGFSLFYAAKKIKKKNENLANIVDPYSDLFKKFKCFVF